MDKSEFTKLLCRNRQLSYDQFLTLDKDQIHDVVSNLDEEANTIFHQFAKDNDCNFLSVLLEKMDISDYHILCFRNCNGMTPIDMAALYRNLEVLNLLIMYAARVQSLKRIFLNMKYIQDGKPDSIHIKCENRLCNRCHRSFQQPVMYALGFKLSPASHALIDSIFSEMCFGEKYYHTTCHSAEEHKKHHRKYILFSTKIRCILDRMYRKCLMAKDIDTITLIIHHIILKAKELGECFKNVFRDCRRCRKSALGNSTLQSKILARLLDVTFDYKDDDDPDNFWYSIVHKIVLEMKETNVSRINRVNVGQYVLQTYYSAYRFGLSYSTKISELLLAWNFDNTFSVDNIPTESKINMSISKIIYGGLLISIRCFDYRFFECNVAIAKHIHVDLNTDGTCLGNYNFGPLLCTILRRVEDDNVGNNTKKALEHFLAFQQMIELLLVNNVDPHLIHNTTALGNGISGLNFSMYHALERRLYGRKKMDCIALIKRAMHTYHQRITLFDLMMNNVRNDEIISELKAKQIVISK